MAQELRLVLIPPITVVDRAARNVNLPIGAIVRGLVADQGDTYAVIQADWSLETAQRTFSAVRSRAPLSPAEIAGAYVGTFATYRQEAGPEVYHLFEVA